MTLRFSGLVLNESGQPAVNQPVPLRLVPLITDWRPLALLRYIGHGIELNDHTCFPLDVAIYDGTDHPKQIRRQDYVDLYESFAEKNDDGEGTLAAVPPDHFMWSDGIVDAFTWLIDMTGCRIEAARSGVALRWYPDTRPIQALLNECPDFAAIFSPSQRRLTRTQEQYRAWCLKREELIRSGDTKFLKANGTPHENNIAKYIARQVHKSSEYVRKALRNRSLYQLDGNDDD